MIDKLKSTQVCYGEEVQMMRMDDCIVFGNKVSLRSLADKLTKLPSAEPERKKGEWKNVAFFTCECSECGEQFHELECNNFCPNCGADMRGDR